MSRMQLCSGCGKKCRATFNVCPTCYPAVTQAYVAIDDAGHIRITTDPKWSVKREIGRKEIAKHLIDFTGADAVFTPADQSYPKLMQYFA